MKRSRNLTATDCRHELFKVRDLSYVGCLILDLQSFDSWVGMFAEKNTNFEIDVDTSNYRMATRFAKFHNIPELTTMLATIADFHQMDETQGVPEHDGYKDIIVRKTGDFARYLKVISERADDVRNGRVSRTEDNMLKITTDGRKAALDLRLISDDYGFTTTSKVFMCAENVFQIYNSTMHISGTQLVFCDTSTPKDGFNIYDELKGLLIKMGVPGNEIAYVHDATTESKREQIFEDMRKGIIWIPFHLRILEDCSHTWFQVVMLDGNTALRKYIRCLELYWSLGREMTISIMVGILPDGIIIIIRVSLIMITGIIIYSMKSGRSG